MEEVVGEPMTEDTWWRKIINSLEIEKDLIGEPEFVTKEERSPEEDLSGQDAAILRFKMDVYVINVLGTGKAYMVTGKSTMEDIGVMTVRDALKLIERRKKK